MKRSSHAYYEAEKNELIRKICALIIQSNVERACKQVGIAERNFYVWIAADSNLAEQYARAREAVGYRGEAELERISRMALEGECDPKAANVASQNTRWLMGRRNPKVYGDRTVLAGDAEAPVVVKQDLSAVSDEVVMAVTKALKESGVA